MPNLDFLTDIAEKELIQSFLVLAKNDYVLQKALQKATDTKTLVNALLASIICIKTREEDVIDKIGGFLKAHPDIEETIELKEIRNKIINR